MPFFGLNMRYDISSADEATRRAGVQYLKDIVRKIAVQGGELFSGVTFAGWVSRKNLWTRQKSAPCSIAASPPCAR